MERLLSMILNRILNRLISRGLNAGFDRMGRQGKGERKPGPDGAGQLAARLRQAARLAGRIGRPRL